MSKYNARINFSLRARTFPCKMNTMNNSKFKADMWRCDSCESCIDSQSHILYWPAYKDLREGRALSSDDDIVLYFREVLAIRMKLDLNLWLGLSDCKCKSPLVLQLRMKMCRDKNILCSDILVSSQYDSLIGNQTSLEMFTLFLS